jgi:hypothetical protein
MEWEYEELIIITTIINFYVSIYKKMNNIREEIQKETSAYIKLFLQGFNSNTR